MSVTYGCRLEWRQKGGTRAVCTDGHTSAFLARSVVLDAAERWGYRRPRWWECWRWRETGPVIEMVEVNDAAS